MSLLLDIEQNLPPPLIAYLSSSFGVPLKRVGDFYEERTGPGCGTHCIWNGGGYYMDTFVCGQKYPSGLTFYCCTDCHHKVGQSQKVFLSYRWCDSDIANKITSYTTGAGIEIIRDVNQIKFLGLISAFMDTAAESRYFIAVVTESYFYSRHCMYEFCRLAESELPIRTIPVMLGESVTEPGIEYILKDYWLARHEQLTREIRGIDPKYTDYLKTELNLLLRIPAHICTFFDLWRQKERPTGKRWLIANCFYLVGAIKSTFKPTEEDATNWTYSNKTVRGEGAEDLPPAAIWNPAPFYLHAISEINAKRVTAKQNVRPLLLGVFLNGDLPGALPPGNHMVLIDELSLLSIDYCIMLQKLLDYPNITILPIFIDIGLRAPASEIGLLEKWQDRLVHSGMKSLRDKIDTMLTGFGPMLERLRDVVIQDTDVLLG